MPVPCRGAVRLGPTKIHLASFGRPIWGGVGVTLYLGGLGYRRPRLADIWEEYKLRPQSMHANVTYFLFHIGDSFSHASQSWLVS
jgi:hypothetical protein